MLQFYTHVQNVYEWVLNKLIIDIESQSRI